uniref:Uncharacterized protein n=1 Tax=Acrobeloides nanus TaxID=290746 RepID=A0A914EHY0_9BILA
MQKKVVLARNEQPQAVETSSNNRAKAMLNTIIHLPERHSSTGRLRTAQRHAFRKPIMSVIVVDNLSLCTSLLAVHQEFPSNALSFEARSASFG